MVQPNSYTNPMTPEQRMLQLLAGGYTDYGIPMMTSPTSQLNLLQDVQSMAFDTVFMYNQGLITPEQLLDSISRATREVVGQPEEYDVKTFEDMAMTSADPNLIDGMNQIKYNGMSAEGVGRWLRDKNANELGEITDVTRANIDSIVKQLGEYEKLFNNNRILMEKRDAGEWDIDPRTGAPTRALEGEAARENLRAQGWKGMFSDPEFWRTIPDVQMMDTAAKMQEQFKPIFDEQDALQKRVGDKTMEEIAKTSSATKKLIDVKKEKGIDISQDIYTTTGGWKRIEDAYQKALNDFTMPRNTRAMGYEDLGTIKGIDYEIRKHDDGKFYLHWDEPNSSGATWNAKPLTQSEINSWRAKRDDRIANPEKYRQEMKLGRTGNKYIVYEGGKSYVENRLPTGTVTNRTQVVSSEKPMTTQEKKSRDYWAQQAAYWTAKGEYERQKSVEKQATDAKAQVEEQTRKAMASGTNPALLALEQLPQIAALMSQPAPEPVKPKYVKPKPRTLSDAEIETMASMIAGGMQ